MCADAILPLQIGAAASLRRRADVWLRLRDLLLPKLVTGQIDVSTLDLDALDRGCGGVMAPQGPEYDYVEKPSMELLAELGWTPVDAFHETLGRAGTLGPRLASTTSSSLIGCGSRCASSIRGRPRPRINEAIEAITKDRSVMDRVRANREVYDLLRDGYRAEWTDEQGDKRIETLRYLDLTTRATTTSWPCSRCGSRATCTAAASTSRCSSTAFRWCSWSSRSPTSRSSRPTTTTSPTTATRSRSCSSPTASCCFPTAAEAQGRIDVRAVGVLR